MKQDYKHLRRDILANRVKAMRERNMPVSRIAQKTGRTRQFVERLLEALCTS